MNKVALQCITADKRKPIVDAVDSSYLLLDVHKAADSFAFTIRNACGKVT